MKTFEIENGATRIRVEAETEKEAVAMVLNGRRQLQNDRAETIARDVTDEPVGLDSEAD